MRSFIRLFLLALLGAGPAAAADGLEFRYVLTAGPGAGKTVVVRISPTLMLIDQGDDEVFAWTPAGYRAWDARAGRWRAPPPGLGQGRGGAVADDPFAKARAAIEAQLAAMPPGPARDAAADMLLKRIPPPPGGGSGGGGAVLLGDDDGDGLVIEDGEAPPRLSGCMKQRVAVARTLETTARILICDEPESGLAPPATLGILKALGNAKGAEDAPAMLMATDPFQIAHVSGGGLPITVEIAEDGDPPETWQLRLVTPMDVTPPEGLR